MTQKINELKGLSESADRIIEQYEDIISNVILKHLESEYKHGDPYACWTAIYGCTLFGFTLPDWCSKELLRVAGELIELQSPQALDTSKKSYKDLLSEILKIDGLARRTADKKRRDAGIQIVCRELIKKGGKRTDHLDMLENDSEISLNRRGLEKIYDTMRKKIESRRTEEIS